MGNFVSDGTNDLGKLTNDKVCPRSSASSSIAHDIHILAASHALPIGNAKLLDPLSVSLFYEEQLHRFTPSMPSQVLSLKQLATDVADYALRDNAPLTLSHRLFLLAGSGLECDELARQANDGLRCSDYGVDLGTYVVARKLNETEALEVLEEYLERDPSLGEVRHFWAMTGLTAWCSYTWCLTEEARSQRLVSAKDRCRRIARNCLRKAITLYTEA